MAKKRIKTIKNLFDFSFDFELLEECPLCGDTVLIPNGKIRWLDMDFWYVVCGKCGLKFMSPRPTQKSYLKFYKDLFWQQKVRNLGFYQEGQMWNTKRYKWDNNKVWNAKAGKKSRMERHLELRFGVITETLRAHINLNKNAEILEVGAGFGVVLDGIKKRYGCNVYAIEPSRESREAIKEFKVIKLIGEYAEDLENLRKKKQKFDAIIFSHSLENTVYPLQIVAWAKQCLKKNGVIYVQCSNLLTFDQMNPYHPYIFSAHSLGLVAKKAGLKPLRAGERLHRMLTMVFKK